MQAYLCQYNEIEIAQVLARHRVCSQRDVAWFYPDGVFLPRDPELAVFATRQHVRRQERRHHAAVLVNLDILVAALT